jgi:DNA-binding response OmpR family regulator
MSKPILLIDDEEKFALMLQELLQVSGYEADYCLNPVEAVERLGREHYDLVITDYKMPQMDGSEFLQKARKINPDLPVIMISGLMNMSELIKVANIGVTLVLEKPFKTEDLLEHVDRFVKSGDPGEMSREARGAEASEMNFQAPRMEVSYPYPATHLADASNENQRFLESIWKMAGDCRHLPFQANTGAEIRLLAKEIMEWVDQDPEAEIVRIDLLDTASEFTRDWVARANPFPGVLVIDLRGVDWNEDAARMLAEWINFLERTDKDLSLCRILYVFPPGTRFDAFSLGIEDAFRQLFATECPVLLPLRDRVMDTARYLTRMLEPLERERIGEERLERLLRYDWPGDYQELFACLSTLKAHLEENEALSEEAFEAILAEEGRGQPPPPGQNGLEGYLKRRQREYILMHRDKGEELARTLIRLGLEHCPLTPEGVLRDEALIYPELLEQADS